ncbi:MAG: V-type ATPase subunit [Deltaproteobacteria bacterium]|nr:V-type ATPase subunit [Deltaproteobacteria bacterium]
MKYYADDVYLHARIYAMRGRLLTLKDYISIVRNRQGFCEEVCDLRNSVEVKETVFKEQIREVIKLAEATGIYADLFIAFLRWFEAFNVKQILSRAFSRPVLEQWYDIGPYAVVDRSLAGDKYTVDDIRTFLAHTYLKEIFDDSPSYERMEIRMDLCTLRNLYDSISLFNPEAKMVFHDLVRMRLAVSGMIRNRRLKEGYQWSDEKIQDHIDMIHGIFDFSPGRYLKKIAEVLNIRIEQIRKSSSRAPDAADIEYYLEQYYYNWILSKFHMDFHSIYCVVGYLWLLNCQIRNLYRIIDGLRFGLPPEIIIERIVCEV